MCENIIVAKWRLLYYTDITHSWRKYGNDQCMLAYIKCKTKTNVYQTKKYIIYQDWWMLNYLIIRNIK